MKKASRPKRRAQARPTQKVLRVIAEIRDPQRAHDRFLDLVDPQGTVRRRAARAVQPDNGRRLEDLTEGQRQQFHAKYPTAARRSRAWRAKRLKADFRLVEHPKTIERKLRAAEQ